MTLATIRPATPALAWAVVAVALAVALPAAPASAQTGVRFHGTNDYITFGNTSQLMLSDFTAEGLIRIEKEALVVPDLARLERAAER